LHLEGQRLNALPCGHGDGWLCCRGNHRSGCPRGGSIRGRLRLGTRPLRTAAPCRAVGDRGLGAARQSRRHAVPARPPTPSRLRPAVQPAWPRISRQISRQARHVSLHRQGLKKSTSSIRPAALAPSLPAPGRPLSPGRTRWLDGTTPLRTRSTPAPTASPRPPDGTTFGHVTAGSPMTVRPR